MIHSSQYLINMYKKKRNIFVTYKEKITESDMINIIKEYRTLKKLKVQNNINTSNNKVLICFETKEGAQRATADINQYPGWKVSLHYSRYKIQENQEECQTDTNNLTEEKNIKKIQTYQEINDDNNKDIIVIPNTDTKVMECHACGLKSHKIKEYQTKQNIYIVNLKHY